MREYGKHHPLVVGCMFCIFFFFLQLPGMINATADQEHDYQIPFNTTLGVNPSDFRTTIAIKVQALVAINASSLSIISGSGQANTKQKWSSHDHHGRRSLFMKNSGHQSLNQETCDDVIYVTGKCPVGTAYEMMTFTVPINVFETVKPQVEAYFSTMLDDSVIICAYINGPESFGYAACNTLNTCAGKFEVNGYTLPAKEYRRNKKLCRLSKKLCDEQVELLRLTNEDIGKSSQ
jgi:hypothetical protein